MYSEFFIDLSNMNDERNGRIFPSKVMLDALIKFHNETATTNNRMYIELDERDEVVDLAKIIGYVDNIELVDDIEISVSIHILSTPMGEVLKNVIKDIGVFTGKLTPRGYIQYDENGDAIPQITSFSLTQYHNDNNQDIKKRVIEFIKTLDLI